MSRRVVFWAAGFAALVGLWLIAAWPSSPPPALPIGGAPAEESAPVAAAQPHGAGFPAARPHPPAESELEAPEPLAQPQPQPEPESPSSAIAATGDLLAAPIGPVAELKQRFASEPRDSAAAEVEPLLRAAFEEPHWSPPLLRSVLCRATVCKIELNWSPDRMSSYLRGMALAAQHFSPYPGVEPREPPGPGVHIVDAYLERRPARAQQ